jgi:hypothetical protein
MAEQGGPGIKLKITVSTVLTAIVNLLDVKFPKQSKEVYDQTAHPTSGTTAYRKMVDSGIRRLEPFVATLGWDDTAATHTAIVTAFDATTAVNMSIEDPGGQEIIAFSAIITSIQRIGAVGTGYTAEVEITPTGAPTIT